MKVWLLLSMGLLASLLGLSGCGKSQPSAAPGEVMGYICSACRTKFYVPQTFRPEFCPQCKTTGLQPLVGYVCGTDNHLTISTRHSKPLPCEQCGAQTASVRAPTAAELEAYGTTKKTKADFP